MMTLMENLTENDEKLISLKIVLHMLLTLPHT